MKLCECGCGQPAPIATRTNTAKGHIKGQPVRFVAGHLSAEIVAKVAEAKRGKPRAAATKEKISKALTGRTDTAEVRAKKRANATRGDKSPVWVGSDASYNAVHNRARAVLPSDCAHADPSCLGMLEVALRHGLPVDLVRTSPRGHRYYIGADIGDGYLRLCRSHHRRHDR